LKEGMKDQPDQPKSASTETKNPEVKS